MKYSVIVLAAVVACSVVLPAQSQSPRTDPWVGTWKLNVAKSRFDPGPPPKSNSLNIEAVAGGGQKHTFDGVNAQGEKTHSERTTTFDGADVPVQATLPPSNSVTTNAFRRTGERSFEVTSKVDGKPTTTTRVVLSTDGKTLTNTQSGTNPRGQQVNGVVIYEKQ